MSLLSVGLILLFIFGEPFDAPRITPQEWVGLLFFPVGLGIGMIAAWRWELLGGLITVGSLLAFYIVEFLFSGDLAGGPFFLIFAVPGPLFFIAWWLSEGQQKESQFN